jgi:hypothetical protein
MEQVELSISTTIPVAGAKTIQTTVLPATKATSSSTV